MTVPLRRKQKEKKKMRESFFKTLYNLAKKDKKVVLIAADTGALYHDKFKENLSYQYLNAGVSEQNMIGVAAGLALSGRIVYVYGIIPFVTMRCYEQIRVDICSMDLPVTIVGIGPGLDYSTLGLTHHAPEDITIIGALPGMKIYNPCDDLTAGLCVRACYKQAGPKYVRLDREGGPLVYRRIKDINFSDGFFLLKQGKDLYIIATGRMVFRGLEVAKSLSLSGISTGVIDLFRIKPFNEEGIWRVVKDVGYIVSLEEHFVKGGIGGFIAEMLAGKKKRPLLNTLGIDTKFCRGYGERNYLQRLNGLDISSIIDRIKNWVKKAKQGEKG